MANLWIRKIAEKKYNESYNKYQYMTEEKLAFEQAYLEANLKIIPAFPLILSIYSIVYSSDKIDFVLFVMIVVILFFIYYIANTALQMEALKEIRNKSNYSSRNRRFRKSIR